jgi:hypothetical protein
MVLAVYILDEEVMTNIYNFCHLIEKIAPVNRKSSVDFAIFRGKVLMES